MRLQARNQLAGLISYILALRGGLLGQATDLPRPLPKAVRSRTPFPLAVSVPRELLDFVSRFPNDELVDVR